MPRWERGGGGFTLPPRSLAMVCRRWQSAAADQSGPLKMLEHWTLNLTLDNNSPLLIILRLGSCNSTRDS